MLCDHVVEIYKEGIRIVWTRRCLRVILHGKNGLIFKAETFDRVII